MMDPRIIEALTAERKELQKKLREMEALQRRLRAVESLLAAYGVEIANDQESPKVEGSQDSEEGKKVLSKYTAPEVLDIIRDYIKGRPHPTPTKELLQVVQSHGFVVRGKNPITNLSAVLSRSPDFQSIGRSGWIYIGAVDGERSTSPVDSRKEGVNTSVDRDSRRLSPKRPWL